MKTNCTSFSIMNVLIEKENSFYCSWIQDCIGSLENAQQRAIDTAAVNSNKITVIVIDRINSPVPFLDHYEIDKNKVYYYLKARNE